LIIIKDHINLMGNNPLRSKSYGPGPRFPDMSEAYNAGWRHIAGSTMSKMGLKPLEGVYAAVSGPSYETPLRSGI
jgi:purine-nucleoside phosphorylase